MRNFQKVGGIAAILWAAILVWAIVHLVVILPSEGFAGPEELYDPGRGIPYLLNAPFLITEYLLTFLYAFLIALIVVALDERLKVAAESLLKLAFVFGLSTVSLNLAEGAIGLFGRAVLSSAHATNEPTLEGLFQASMTVHDSLLFAGIFSVGLWILLISCAALQSRGLPKGLCYLGILAGLQAIGAMVFPLLSLPVLPLVWSFWLGLVLLRDEGQRPTTT